MPFYCNPALWFICKLCRKTFPDTAKLIAHKLENHLWESLDVKCIVFEEKILDHGWIPSSQELSSNQDHYFPNLNGYLPEENNYESISNVNVNVKATRTRKIQQRIKFKNPYVLLKTLTARELNSVSAPSLQLHAKNSSFSEIEGRPYPFEQPKTGTDVHDGEENQELLFSAAVIKTEPYDSDESNDRGYLEPQEIPLTASILSTSTSQYQWSPATISTISKHPEKRSYHENGNLRLQRLPQESAVSKNRGAGAGTDAGAGAGNGQSNKNQKSFVCPICSFSFSTRRSLTRHVRTHSTNIGCPHCHLKFKSKAVLRVHLIVRHGRVSNFRCRICKNYFPTRADLISHEAGYTGARPFQCDFPNCGARLKSRTNLYVHTRLVHGKELGIPQFECPTCGKSFALGKMLNMHTKKAHANITEPLQVLS